MKKTTIKERFENAVEAFFEDNSLVEENSLAYPTDTSLLQQSKFVRTDGKADKFLNIIKQLFLFFPGTFLLFNLTLFTTAVILDSNIAQLTFPNKLILTLLVSSFMTMFGLGNIRNPKHLIIPASVFLFGIFSGAVIFLSGGGLKFIDDFAIYLLPIALIIPFLAKGWVDRNIEEID